MSIENVRSKVEGFLSRYVNLNDMDYEDNFLKKGLINSLFYIQLLTYLENEFDIQVEPSDVDPANFSSIANITNFVAVKSSIRSSHK